MAVQGFSLVKEAVVEEVASTVRIYRHDKTGAVIASFINSDENKVFGVSFRTPPSDSTGVAHILEHSVLCGSKKYPVKEPFVELLKGSLQTFLNAFTYPDKTCYPVASANVADFRNLTDVYLDAVLFPVISPNIFKQEGWHIEADSVEGPLTYKGVVYNEMKGAFSSPESVLGRYCLHSLFPDTIYGLESGGDPVAIPDLTYESFKNFHSTYYHPSNARFFYWGNDNEDERLMQLKEVLDKFESIDVSSAITLQKRYAAPRSVEVPFASSEDEKGMVVVNWLGPDVLDIETGLAFRMLDHILLGMPASPLRRALIESELGEDIAGQGLEAELRQLTFDVGLKGVAPEHSGAVEKIVLDTLTTLTEKGIPPEYVEAAINSVEFSLRENNTGRFPVGLSIMLRSLTTWLHDGDLLAPLRFEAPLSAIKRKIASGDWYFEGLIKEWFLQNTHRVTVTLVPEKGMSEKIEQAEKNVLKSIFSRLNEEERASLVQETQLLNDWQAMPDSEEALASIPRLSKKDLPLTGASIPTIITSLCEKEPKTAESFYFHPLPTAGIVYVEAVFDLSSIPENLMPLVPLFGRALLEIGTTKQDFVTLNMSIARKTGGMDTDCLFTTHLSKGDDAIVTKFVLEGKTTPDKLPELFDLMKEVVLDVNLDQKDRFLRMVLEEKARNEHGIIPSGHMVVATRLRSAFSGANGLTEQTDGVSYLSAIKDLAERTKNDFSSVLADLIALKNQIFTKNGLLFNITALPDQKNLVTPFVESFYGALPEGKVRPNVARKPCQFASAEALIMPAQVNYTGMSVNLYENGYTWHGSAHVILKYLRTGYLWEKVRVQGGAYGCVCGIDRTNGGFFMVSYRDPAILPTLNTYKAAAEYLQKVVPTAAQLDAAIVGAIGEIDSYQLPDAKGRTAFMRELTGFSDDLRQQLRDEVLGTVPADFKRFGQALEGFESKGRICALGGTALEKVAKENGWQVTQIV